MPALLCIVIPTIYQICLAIRAYRESFQALSCCRETAECELHHTKE